MEPDDEVVLALLGLVRIGYEIRADYCTQGPHHWTEWKRLQPTENNTVEEEADDYRRLIARGERYELRPLYTTKGD